MSHRTPRLATRALILADDRLLLVNAYRARVSDLWCAPGGGAVVGQSLHDNLKREIWEETGLTVAVGAPCLVNEFHDPKRGFQQVDVSCRGRSVGGQISDSWRDPEGVVTARRFFGRDELRDIRFKPDSLPQAAWGVGESLYDPLELIVR